MDLEDKVLNILKEKTVSLGIIELLLYHGELKTTYTGGLSGGMHDLIRLLELENIIDLEKEKRFLEGVKHLNPRKTGKRKEYYTVCGRFYGYPECCIADFIKNTMPAVGFKNKFLTKPVDYVLNRIYHAYIFHVPCRAECGKTKKIAETYREYIRNNFSRISSLFEKDYLQRRENFLRKKGLARLI